MSKIDELLKNEKVEWRKLGEVALISGAGVDKKINHDEVPIKLLNYMDVYKNLYINKNTPNMKVTASISKIEQCNIEYGDIFITPSSETEEDIFMSSVAKEIIENTVYSYHIMRIRLKSKNFTTSCYLNYLFRADIFRKEMRKKVFGNTRKTIAKSEIENLKIPIPSLETQEKIVKILDKFTNYVTELQAELQARTKQYEYYRDMLLSEGYLNKISSEVMGLENNREVSFYTLSKVFNTRNGYTPSKSVQEYWNYKDIPWFKMEDIRENGNILNCAKNYVSKSAIKGEPFEQNSIILSTSATIGEHALITVPFLANQRFTCFSLKDNYKKEINIKYIYYYFYIIDKWCSNNIKISNFPSVDVSTLLTQIIPIPDIFVQNKVVEILDKFQSLLSDTQGLLPQEIKQRQKQYEYYREKLLTFDLEGETIPRQTDRQTGNI